MVARTIVYLVLSVIVAGTANLNVFVVKIEQRRREMGQYLQAVWIDIMQWPPVCWVYCVSFCTFVIGVIIGGFMVDGMVDKEPRC